MHDTFKKFGSIVLVVFSLGQLYFFWEQKSTPKQDPYAYMEGYTKKEVPLVEYCVRVGSREFYEILGKKINYPKTARERMTQARVYAQFRLDNSGKITDIKINPYKMKGVFLEEVIVTGYSPIKTIPRDSRHQHGITALQVEVIRSLFQMNTFKLEMPGKHLPDQNMYILPVYFKLS